MNLKCVVVGNDIKTRRHSKMPLKSYFTHYVTSNHDQEEAVKNFTVINDEVDIVIGERKCNIKILDTSESSKFKKITTQYYSRSDVFIFLYDVDDDESLKALKKRWLKETEKYSNSAAIIFFGIKQQEGDLDLITEQVHFDEVMGKKPYDLSLFNIDNISASRKAIIELILKAAMNHSKQFKKQMQNEVKNNKQPQAESSVKAIVPGIFHQDDSTSIPDDFSEEDDSAVEFSSKGKAKLSSTSSNS
jgi:GTPase SAR1 family protein